MIDDPNAIQRGRIVFLYPQSKQASRACHRLLTVTVMKDPRAHWPMVMVQWKEDGADRWELVHRDNIRLRKPGGTTTKAESKEGDTTRDSGGMGKWAAVRKMPGKPKPIEITEEQEQGTLF